MGANERQVGGGHYKVGGEEHWDRVARLDLDYFQGQITKYVERWKNKGGIQDLEKAAHFLQKYLEVEVGKKVAAENAAKKFWALQTDNPTIGVYGTETAPSKRISRRKVRPARKK